MSARPWELRLTMDDGGRTVSRHASALAACERRQSRYTLDSDWHSIARAQITNTVTGQELPELPECRILTCQRICSDRTTGLEVNLCEPHYMDLGITEQHAYGLYRDRERELIRYRRLCAQAGICAQPLCWRLRAVPDLERCDIHQEDR